MCQKKHAKAGLICYFEAWVQKWVPKDKTRPGQNLGNLLFTPKYMGGIWWNLHVHLHISGKWIPSGYD
jgi:hypothetical protein